MKRFQFFFAFLGVLFIQNFTVADTVSVFVKNTKENRRNFPNISWDSIVSDAQTIEYVYTKVPNKADIKLAIDTIKKIIDFEDKQKYAMNGGIMERKSFIEKLRCWAESPRDCFWSIDMTHHVLYKLFPQIIEFAKRGDLYELQCLLAFNLWFSHPAYSNPDRLIPIWKPWQVEKFFSSKPEKNTVSPAKTQLSSY
jgi:hypothetical protein